MNIPITQVVNEYVNAEIGIRVVVIHNDTGYGVQLVDMDSGMAMPSVRYYETQGQAQAYAVRCAFG